MTSERSRLERKQTQRDRLLVFVLRVFAVVDMLAFIAVVMPRAWIVFTHDAAGLGDFPEAPVASYLARSASALARSRCSLWAKTTQLYGLLRVALVTGCAGSLYMLVISKIY